MATHDPIASEAENVIPVQSMTLLQRRWGWLLVLGIVQVIGGALALVLPVVASIAAAIVFGAVLLVSGAFQLVHAFKIRPWKGLALQALVGVLYIVAGALALLFPLTGAITLTIVVGALLIADGIVRLVLAFRVQPRSSRAWFTAAGIASTFLGILMLIGWPATGTWAIGILLGASMLFSGVANCALAISFRARNTRGAAHESLRKPAPRSA